MLDVEHGHEGHDAMEAGIGSRSAGAVSTLPRKIPSRHSTTTCLTSMYRGTCRSTTGAVPLPPEQVLPRDEFLELVSLCITLFRC